MKHVLRSCLDPLPRFLTTRGLALIVAMVLGGTALSVHEYLESGHEPERAWPRPSTVQAHAPCGPCTGGHLDSTRSYAAADQIGAVSPCGARPGVPAATSSVNATSAPTPATLYRPDTSSGS